MSKILFFVIMVSAGFAGAFFGANGISTNTSNLSAEVVTSLQIAWGSVFGISAILITVFIGASLKRGR